jgi:HlyD family secretion protein
MRISKNSVAAIQLRTVFNLGAIRELTDGQLLERFATESSEASELAFAVLVERHGPMVLRVCRSVLSSPHDSEDAFQATFLVLVKKARGLWVRDSLGPWLHQVAYRTANCARLAAARRKRHEIRVNAPRSEGRAAMYDDIEALLQEEIHKLPERYRAPVVLCDLEGRTHEQAARHLGCPVGTVKSRQARARERLRASLRRRGVAPESALLASSPVFSGAETQVGSALIAATTRAAAQLAVRRTAVQTSTLALAQGVSLTMSLTRWSKLVLVALITGASVSGAAVLAQLGGGSGPSSPRPIPALLRTDGAKAEQGNIGGGDKVIQRASLEAARSYDVYNNVEGQIVIIQIKPEGSRVKKDDIVCLLDSAALRDRLTNQQITSQQAGSAYGHAKRVREIAEAALVAYTEGTAKQELNTALAEATIARSAIQKAESRLERTRRARERIKAALAAKKGELSPADIAAELDVDDLLDATEERLLRERKTLELAESKREVIEKYTRENATKALQADIERKQTDELSSQATWELEKSKEKKLVRQIDACTLKAPAEGIVVYANDPMRNFNRALRQIEEGATVRERQKILVVVDPDGPMRANAKVTENHIDQVKRGMKAKIRIDAFPGRLLDGTVVDVAPLPDALGFLADPSPKVYSTRVRIDDRLPGLRPGMTAEVEILLDDKVDAKREKPAAPAKPPAKP